MKINRPDAANFTFYFLYVFPDTLLVFQCNVYLSWKWAAETTTTTIASATTADEREANSNSKYQINNCPNERMNFVLKSYRKIVVLPLCVSSIDKRCCFHLLIRRWSIFAPNLSPLAVKCKTVTLPMRYTMYMRRQGRHKIRRINCASINDSNISVFFLWFRCNCRFGRLRIFSYMQFASQAEERITQSWIRRLPDVCQ